MSDTEDPEADGAPQQAAPFDAEAQAAERDDYQARWQRATADYQNLKRRSAGEVENAVRRSLESLLQGLLLVVDHLDLALSSPARSDDARSIAEGVRMTRDQLLATLRGEGVEPITEGGAFDPNLHEAVATLERDDVEPGQVVDTLRRGYTWRGQVLRAAQVRVSRQPLGAQGGG